MVQRGPQGRYGGASHLTATSYVNLGNGSSLQLTGSMTLTAWIRISANPFDDGAIVAKLGSGRLAAQDEPGHRRRTAAIQISSDGADCDSALQRDRADRWHLVSRGRCLRRLCKTLNIYVNGVLDNGVLSGTFPAAQFNAPYEVNIGQRTGVPRTFNFVGTD